VAALRGSRNLDDVSTREWSNQNPTAINTQATWLNDVPELGSGFVLQRLGMCPCVATGKKTSDSVSIEEEVWMNIPSQEAKLNP
jgi:hypothetical protein